MLLVARHGVTEWNKRGLFMGSTDLDLCEEGFVQAEKLLSALPPTVDALLASVLKRTIQTAAPISQTFNLPVLRYPEFNERNFGAWEGRPWKEMPEKVRELDRCQNFDYRSVGGESATEFEERVRRGLRHIQEHGYLWNQPLLITSGGVIRMLQKLTGAEIMLGIENCQIFEFNI